MSERNLSEAAADLPSPTRLKVLVCSANMGNAEPSLSDIKAWIPPLGACDQVTYFDGESSNESESNRSQRDKEEEDAETLQLRQELKDQAAEIKKLKGSLAKMEGTFDLIAIGMQESTWKHGKEGGESTHREGSESMHLEPVEPATFLGEGEGKEGEKPSSQRTLKKEVAFQQDSSLSADSILLEKKMAETLGSRYKVLLHQVRGQMRLVLWVRSALYASMKPKLRVKMENTGIGHMMANKGGIVATIKYQNHTRITFVTAHLAAHEGEKYYHARCNDLREIFKGTRGGVKNIPDYDQAVTSHHMFVMGDLNFRTKFEPCENEKLDKEEKVQKHMDNVQRALDFIKKKDFAGLYAFDELSQGVANKELLLGFETLPCTFSPTFKVQREPGFVYKEQRTPSFTDRILYKSAPGLQGRLQQVSYEACPDFISSDHKPIRGAFSIVPNASKPKPRRNPVSKTIVGLNRNKKVFRVTISELKGKDLPAMDVDGKSDPYVIASWNGVKMTKDPHHKNKRPFSRTPGEKKWPCTSYVNKELNPEWPEDDKLSMILYENDNTLSFDSMDSPNIGSKIGVDALLFLTVMDYDFGNQDDIMGSVTLNVKELVQGVTAADAPQSKTIKMKVPLVKYAVEQGTIEFTLRVEKLDNSSSIVGGDSVSEGGGCCTIS